MAKGRTLEEQKQFVQENYHLVPAKSKEMFDNSDDAKKYTLMKRYVTQSKKSQFNVNAIVNEITKLEPNQKQIEKLISVLSDWTNTVNKKKLDQLKKDRAKIDKEIAKLEGK